MSVAISIKNLNKSFHVRGNRKSVALHGIQLNIDEGEMVALIGPSGSGKSTLLRHIGGLVRADKDSGSVEVSGQVVQQSGQLHRSVRKKRTEIGYIFQQFNLINRMSVLRNVLLGRLGHMPRWRGTLGLFNATEKNMAVAALNRVGLAELALQRASTLSGGQQQRVAIARALTQQARLVLADEPIASLDPESARRVMDTLKDIHQKDKRTVVVTLHQVEYALKYCDRAVALKDGEIVYDGLCKKLTPDLLNQLYGMPQMELAEKELPAVGAMQPTAA